MLETWQIFSLIGDLLLVTPGYLKQYQGTRDVAKVFSRRECSNDRRVFGPKAHPSVPLARYT